MKHQARQVCAFVPQRVRWERAAKVARWVIVAVMVVGAALMVRGAMQ